MLNKIRLEDNFNQEGDVNMRTKHLWYTCLILTVTMLGCLLISSITFADSTKKEDRKPDSIQVTPTVYLKGHQLKVTKNRALITRYKKGEVGSFLVIFAGPIEVSMKSQVEKDGAKLIEYIPDFAFLVSMTPEIAEKVAALPYVLEIQEYLPDYKIHPSLKDSDGRITGGDEITLTISTFDDDMTSLDRELANINAKKLSQFKGGFTVKLNHTQIEKLASHPNVKYIEKKAEFVLFNDIAKSYIHTDELWNLGYTGEGQIIGICDTGLDTGVDDSSMHLDFQGRIDAIYALGRSTADDPHGHGTHVAGSVLGNGANSNGQIKGMAPQARLVFQSVLNDSNGLTLPSDLNDLFQQAWDAGARIHTNSWGSVGQDYINLYDEEAQQVDQFIWNHDMIILFSAGNNGSSYGSISTPGTAKNVITVGASENDRPEKDSSSDDPTTIAYFSGRGRTDDGRIKPDVVAPGTYILSTRSSKAPDRNPSQNYNAYYEYMSGTSMATPLTAGAVAIARQYMINNWGITPKPALMKAAIINGATDLQYGVPSTDQGWGRVNLASSLHDKEYQYDQDSSLVTYGSKSYSYSVEDNTTPLRITLVWTDYPGSVTAGKALVNDLDLTVIGPDGTEYYGNNFASPYHTEYDRLNNVENVWISTPKLGTYVVTVNGYNVPYGPQPFAIFASADFGVPDISTDTTPPTCSLTAPTAGSLSGIVTVSANADDNFNISQVEFYANSNLIGSDNTNPYSINWDTTKLMNGPYSLTAKAYDPASNVTTSTPVSVTVNNLYDRTVTEQFAGKVDYYATANADNYIHVTDPGLIQLNLSWGNKADLDMSLYNPSGIEVAKVNSTNKPEVLAFNALNPGLYKIKVTAFSGADVFQLSATHDINTTITNQYQDTGAVDVAGIRSHEHLIPVSSASGTINITVSWEGDAADIDVYLYDPSGKQVAKSFSKRNPETISYLIPAGAVGTYKIKVEAYSGHAVYTIHVFSPR